MATIKTCSRCKGKGIGSWVVVHGGVPGGCYKCDLSGKVQVFTMAERVEKFIARCEAHLKELEETGNAWKGIQKEDHDRRNARRAKRGVDPLPLSEMRVPFQLEQARKTYREVRALLLEVQASGKVTAQQQPQTLPYKG